MKASELITTLQKLQTEFGDLVVFMDVGPDGLLNVGEIGVDVDDTGIILWVADGEEG